MTHNLVWFLLLIQAGGGTPPPPTGVQGDDRIVLGAKQTMGVGSPSLGGGTA
jgi:hypothetical protein